MHTAQCADIFILFEIPFSIVQANATLKDFHSNCFAIAQTVVCQYTSVNPSAFRKSLKWEKSFQLQAFIYESS